MLKRFDRVTSYQTRSGRGPRRFFGLLVPVRFSGRTPTVLIETILAKPLLDTIEFVAGTTPFRHFVTVGTVRPIVLFRDLGDFGTGRVVLADSRGDRGDFGHALFAGRIIGTLVRELSPGKFTGRFLIVHRTYFAYGRDKIVIINGRLVTNAVELACGRASRNYRRPKASGVPVVSAKHEKR